MYNPCCALLHQSKEYLKRREITFPHKTHLFVLREPSSILLKTNIQPPNGLESDFFSDFSGVEDLRYSSLGSQTLLGIDQGLRWIPMLIPVLAYVMYDPTAECFASILDALANNNFVAVDGGAYQAKIIAPAINGYVW
jgi:hypothetical protein